ncbi:MAG: hypothetical protein R3C58_03895 [Parvularculaceae bacterium]
MAYGVKRGVKTPGNFTFMDMAGLALSGAAGIIAALVTDYQQSGEASALFTINSWVVQLGGLLGFTDIPLWTVIIGMTMIGAGSIFYFQPITRQGAFAQGAGLLAVLMTAIPANLAGGIEGISDNLPGLQSAALTENAGEARIIQATYSEASVEAEIVQVQQTRAAKYDLHLTINFPNGLPDGVDTMLSRGSLRGRLYNEDTKEKWDLFRTSGGTVRKDANSLVIHAGVPARSEKGRLWVRVEAQGYTINIQSYDANMNQPVEWTVDMEPSNVPLFVQRLGKSYWF